VISGCNFIFLMSGVEVIVVVVDVIPDADVVMIIQ